MSSSSGSSSSPVLPAPVLDPANNGREEQQQEQQVAEMQSQQQGQEEDQKEADKGRRGGNTVEQDAAEAEERDNYKVGTVTDFSSSSCDDSRNKRKANAIESTSTNEGGGKADDNISTIASTNKKSNNININNTDIGSAAPSSSSSGPSSCHGLLDMLNEDSIRSILIRTCAVDHNNLRQTCKQFLSILNSFQFRQERANLGYTEVQSVQLLSPRQQYQANENRDHGVDEKDDDISISSSDTVFQEEYDHLGESGRFGKHSWYEEHFRIVVDGIPLKMDRLSIHLLPRTRRTPFFTMIELLGGRDSLVKWFSNRGRPRLQCLREAMSLSNNNNNNNNNVSRRRRLPLLYISHFVLPREYRSLTSAVGPMILQSLLSCEVLKDQWSIAMHIPKDEAFSTQQDDKLSKKFGDLLYRNHPLVNPNGRLQSKQEEEEEEQLYQKTKKQWETRRKELVIEDMRQFFRAGFHQVSDVLVLPPGEKEDENDDNGTYYFYDDDDRSRGKYYVYATPSDIFVEDSEDNNETTTKKPILSEQDALQIKILNSPPIDPSRRHPGKTKEEKELFDEAIKKGNYMKQLTKTIKEYRTKPVRELPRYYQLFSRSEGRLRTYETKIQEAEQMKRGQEQAKRGARVLIRDAESNPERQKQILQTLHEALQVDEQLNNDTWSQMVVLQLQLQQQVPQDLQPAGLSSLLQQQQQLQQHLQQQLQLQQQELHPLLSSTSTTPPLEILDSLYRPSLEQYDNKLRGMRDDLSKARQVESDLVETLRREEVPRLIAEEEEKLRSCIVESKQELKDMVDKSVVETACNNNRTDHDVERLIIRSNVLHACAYNLVGQIPLIRFFLEDMLPISNHKARSDAINYPNECGATALMAAVGNPSTIDSLSHCYELCTYLIDRCGANKNITTRDGLTALGVFRRKLRDYLDSNNGFLGNVQDWEANKLLVEQLESLLMPTLGPSPADTAILENDEDDDDDDDDDSDSDSDDENTDMED